MRHQSKETRADFQHKITLAIVRGLLAHDKVKEATDVAMSNGMTPQQFGIVTANLTMEINQLFRKVYGK